ncbi:MAG: YeeE/YedE family protein [Bacteroidetes bacterium]|nr:YeeE/YedE family protein [Bacteroidota bacterium]
MRNIKFLIAGVVFGIILVKSQVISWFRIQEMFRVQAFHMYGIIGSAIAVGMVSVLLLKRFKAKTISGEPVEIPKKQFTWGNVWGGLIFGLGWAITGACPGPLYALLGSGFGVIGMTLLSAILGTWVYGALKDKLPH